LIRDYNFVLIRDYALIFETFTLNSTQKTAVLLDIFVEPMIHFNHGSWRNRNWSVKCILVE